MVLLTPSNVRFIIAWDSGTPTHMHAYRLTGSSLKSIEFDNGPGDAADRYDDLCIGDCRKLRCEEEN
jgi:hypothetical protein